jgi:hypothetical protein
VNSELVLPKTLLKKASIHSNLALIKQISCLERLDNYTQFKQALNLDHRRISIKYVYITLIVCVFT